MDLLNEMFGMIKTINPVIEKLLSKYNSVLKEEASFKVLKSGINIYEKNYNDIQLLNDQFFSEKNKFDSFGNDKLHLLPDNFKKLFEAYAKVLTAVATTATTIEKLKGSIVNNLNSPWKLFKHIGRIYKDNRMMFTKFRTINKLQQEYNNTLNLVIKQ